MDALSGANMQTAGQIGPNAALDRVSNNKNFEIGQSRAINSFMHSSEALKAHKDDYQHWTNVRITSQCSLAKFANDCHFACQGHQYCCACLQFVCSQADGVAADVPKVQYRLDEPHAARQHASAPAGMGPKSSRDSQPTPSIPLSRPDLAQTGTSMIASAVSDHTATRLPSSNHIPELCKPQCALGLPGNDTQNALRSGASARIEDHATFEAPFHQEEKTSHSTPQKRPGIASQGTDGSPTVALTLAASTPSTTWRTPAVGPDIGQSGANCDGFTSCLQDVSPMLNPACTKQASPKSVKDPGQQDCPGLCPAVPEIAASSIGPPEPPRQAHAMQSPSLGQDRGHLCGDDSDGPAVPPVCFPAPGCVYASRDYVLKASASPHEFAQCTSQTTSMDSDGMDEILATISTPESAKKRFNSTRSQGLKIALPVGSTIEVGGACFASPLDTGVVEQCAEGYASAVVPAERLDIHQSAAVEQLLQWGRGGLAPSLMQERDMLLHKVLEVSFYLTPVVHAAWD